MDDGQQMEFDIPKRPKEKKLRGIGGWLVLFQLHIVLSTSSTIVSTMNFFALSDKIDILTAVALVLFLCAQILCIVYFYRMKMAFRIIYIIAAVINLIMLGIGLSKNAKEILEYSNVFIGIVIYAIVIGALFTSKRVKNTFS